MTTRSAQTEMIISVDDHVFEPPDIWSERLPGKYLDRGPRVERDRGHMKVEGGEIIFDKGAKDGTWGDWWIFDDQVYPLSRLSAAVGLEPVDNSPVTFDEIAPGCWRQGERLEAMDLNGVQASLCFPNNFSRFCGQTFSERPDRDLSLLCVRAYNDWMIDEWCAGDAYGRLIPLTIVPLWDVELAAEEIRRCAAKGSHAVTFSENPAPLGLPSLHDKNQYWDPFFAACEETETVVNLHIGSSSTMPTTAPDAPLSITGTLLFQNLMGSLCDYIYSGVLERFPQLSVALSEGQVGWMPYLLQRLDRDWEKERSGKMVARTSLRRPPSSYARDQIFGCIFDDEVGLRNRDSVGMDNIMFETDYPHSDTTFPASVEVADRLCQQAGLNAEERHKLLRGNAIRVYGLHRYGITD